MRALAAFRGEALALAAPATAEAQPTVSLAVDDAAAAEAGQDTGSFAVTRTNEGNTAASLTVRVTLHSSCQASSNYTIRTHSNGQITIRDFDEGIFRDGFEEL